MVKSDTFQKAVSHLRNMYYIPKKGFPSPYREESPDLLGPIDYPKKWVFANDNEEINFFATDIEALRKRFALYPDTWHFVIRNYIFYNKLPNLEKNLEEIYDLCEVSDIEAEKKHLLHTKNLKNTKIFYTLFSNN